MIINRIKIHFCKLKYVLFLACLSVVTVSHADTIIYQLKNYNSDSIPVYKGELVIRLVGTKNEVRVNTELVRTQGLPYTLRLRYRSNTQEVLRVSITDLVLINARSGEVLSFPNQSMIHASAINAEGYWVVDVQYPGLALDYEDYRLHAKLTLGLRLSQRVQNIQAMLQRNFSYRPNLSIE